MAEHTVNILAALPGLLLLEESRLALLGSFVGRGEEGSGEGVGWAAAMVLGGLLGVAAGGSACAHVSGEAGDGAGASGERRGRRREGEEEGTGGGERYVAGGARQEK